MLVIWVFLYLLALRDAAPVPGNPEPTECKVPIPNAGFKENKTVEQVLGDVAKVMNLARSGLRYGKRADVSKKFFDARTREIAYAALYPHTFVTPEWYAMAKRQLLPAIPNFYPSARLVNFVSFMIHRENARKPFMFPDNQNYNPSRKSNVEKLFQLLALKERAQGNGQLRAIKQHYRTAPSFARARPGKRALSELPKVFGATSSLDSSEDQKKNGQDGGNAGFRPRMH